MMPGRRADPVQDVTELDEIKAELKIPGEVEQGIGRHYSIVL